MKLPRRKFLHLAAGDVLCSRETAAGLADLKGRLITGYACSRKPGNIRNLGVASRNGEQWSALFFRLPISRETRDGNADRDGSHRRFKPIRIEAQVRLTLSLFPSPRRTRLVHEVGASARNANERWAAEVRGQELLRSWLSPEQRRQYDQQASFEVIGSDTGKRYRICKGDVFNIQELDDHGVQVRAWCVTADGMPIGDVNLAQKIALETFESEVLRNANRSSGTVWPSRQPCSWT